MVVAYAANIATARAGSRRSHASSANSGSASQSQPPARGWRGGSRLTASVSASGGLRLHLSIDSCQHFGTNSPSLIIHQIDKVHPQKFIASAKLHVHPVDKLGFVNVAVNRTHRCGQFRAIRFGGRRLGSALRESAAAVSGKRTRARFSARRAAHACVVAILVAIYD